METKTELSCCCYIEVDKPLNDSPRFRGLSVLKYSAVSNEYSSGINFNRYGNQIDLVEFYCTEGYSNSVCAEYTFSEYSEARLDLLDALALLELPDSDLKSILSCADRIFGIKQIQTAGYSSTV